MTQEQYHVKCKLKSNSKSQTLFYFCSDNDRMIINSKSKGLFMHLDNGGFTDQITGVSNQMIQK